MPGIAGQAARRVAGGLHPQLARRVGIQQVALQHAALDHHGAPRGHAFIVERRGAEQAGNGGVVNHREVLAGHLFAQLAGQKRLVPVDRHAVHGVKEVVEQRCGDVRGSKTTGTFWVATLTGFSRRSARCAAVRPTCSGGLQAGESARDMVYQ